MEKVITKRVGEYTCKYYVRNRFVYILDSSEKLLTSVWVVKTRNETFLPSAEALKYIERILNTVPECVLKVSPGLIPVLIDGYFKMDIDGYLPCVTITLE